MDVTEINPRRAGGNYATGEDRTYRIAANIIKKILGGGVTRSVRLVKKRVIHFGAILLSQENC
jgi:hypothetical protein